MEQNINLAKICIIFDYYSVKYMLFNTSESMFKIHSTRTGKCVTNVLLHFHICNTKLIHARITIHYKMAV
jgi:hypothetical protein